MTSAAVLLFFFGMVELCAASKHTSVARKSPFKWKPGYGTGSITADASTEAASSPIKVLSCGGIASLSAVLLVALALIMAPLLTQGRKLPHTADTNEAAPSPFNVLSCVGIASMTSAIFNTVVHVPSLIIKRSYVSIVGNMFALSWAGIMHVSCLLLILDTPHDIVAMPLIAYHTSFLIV